MLPSLVERYERETGTQVVTTIGASGNLARQIRQGAPFDIFLSANRRYVEDLAAEGVIRPETVAPYGVGVLVLAVNEESGVAVETLDDLSRPEVKRIAIANPDHAPYGVAARQALQSAGLWEALSPRIVRGDSVVQTLQFVQTGNAEAGLVALSNAMHAEAVRVIPIDPDLYQPITQVLGVVADSGSEDEARSFARFLLGETAQSILARDGFRGRDAPPPRNVP